MGKLFMFPHGFNSKYNPICVRILDKEKFYSLSEVFHIVRGVMLCYDNRKGLQQRFNC
uniref:Uncharacterized protein n=1 Tax=Cajanus cajan TaxID=3821 RepID=A0A151TZ10_CAJCA|nr:hypothetical protein KK1_004900 [Cajanus cajan]